MKKFTLVALFLAQASIVAAQTTVNTGPVDTTMKFAWNLPDNIALSDAPTFEVRLRDSNQSGVVTALTNVQCVASTPLPTCQSQLTPANVDALNRIGSHSLTLTYFRTDVGEGPASSPFVLKSPAAAPTNLKIIQ